MNDNVYYMTQMRGDGKIKVRGMSFYLLEIRKQIDSTLVAGDRKYADFEVTRKNQLVNF